MVIEVNKALLLLKTACLGKIWFSRYRAKRGVPHPPETLNFLRKKIFSNFFWFSCLIISFNSIQVFPLMFSCSHTNHLWHQDLDFFRFFPIFYSICLNSIFLTCVFCIFCWSILSVLWCRNCVETSPTRTLQFSTQLSYEAKNSLCVCVCLSRKS